MQDTSTPHIVSADRIGDGVFIEFDDGRSALYSAPLLYTSLSEAVVFNIADLEQEAETEN